MLTYLRGAAAGRVLAGRRRADFMCARPPPVLASRSYLVWMVTVEPVAGTYWPLVTPA